MSESDSFIEEVTEEVRRDQLFGMMKRYGWIAVLVVLALVGGTAWREFSQARDTARAEALGDAMMTALENNAAEPRAEALAAIEATGDAAAIAALLQAGELVRADKTQEAAALLQGLAARPDLSQSYRDLAAFKALLLGDGDAATRRADLEALANAGGPLRLFAEEQLALAELQSGDAGAAQERLQRIVQDAETTQGLRQRASQLIVALGGTPAELPGGSDAALESGNAAGTD